MNISKNRNLFKFGLTPIVKSSGRSKWQRLPKHHVFYYRSPVHQNHYVLSFAFAFDKEDEIYQFAIAPPYSVSRLQAYLTALDTRFSGKFQRSAIGKSLVSTDFMSSMSKTYLFRSIFFLFLISNNESWN